MDVEAEPPPGGSVRLDWLEPIEPTMLVRYRIPGVGHPDRPVFDVIARLLRGSDGLPAASAQGASRGVDWQANASSSGSQNTLTMQARAGRDEDLGALERTALGEVERLRREPVDEASLARVRREFRLDWELLRSERGALATQFGSFAIADDWRTLRTHYQRRATATAEEVRRLAERYLVAPIIHFSLQELARIREPGGAPTGDELEQVKGGLVFGKWQGTLDGARDASATYASEAARFGSLDRLMKWPQAVRAVTAEDVGAAARKYVHPEIMGTVVIGQIDKVRQARHPRWPVALDDLMAAARR